MTIRRIPKLRRTTDGRVFAVWPRSNGKRKYFGKAGPDAERQYQQWISRLLADDADYSPPVAENSLPRIVVLIAEYLRWVDSRLPISPDTPRNRTERENVKHALRPLGKLFGDESAAKFGPRKLATIQKYLIHEGLSRSTINGRIGRIRRFFKWCVAQEFVPPAVHWGLTAVPGIRKGTPGVRESGRGKQKAIPADNVLALLPYLSPVVATMVQVQYFCGMRPQDVVRMRACDVDRSGEIWLYRPADHKNEWRGQSLVKAIPRIVQAALLPFLDRLDRPELAGDSGAFLFDPRESAAWHRFRQPQRSRKTPLYPSEARRVEAKKRDVAERETDAERSGRRGRRRFTPATYRQAIDRAFRKAENAGVTIPRWHPHQLRHSIATQIDGWFGRQAAQRWLGHAKLDTTGIYVESQVADLVMLARQLDQRWAETSGAAAPRPVLSPTTTPTP